MKKTLALVLTLMLLASLCPLSLADSYEMDPNKKYEITISNWTAGPVDNDNAPILDLVEKETGVRAVFDNIDGTQYNDLINLRIASGDAPDVFSLTPHATMVKFYEQGALRTIPESVIAERAPHLYELFQKEAPHAFHIVHLKEDPNELLAIPQYKFHAQFIFPFVWRMDWLRAVGIDKVPDNLEELETAMYAFAKKDPDGNGKDDTYGISTSGLQAVFGAYGQRPPIFGNSTSGAWVELEDGSLGYGAVQPEMKEALAKLAQWYADGVIDPEFVTGENLGGRADLTQAFHTNRIGLSLHGDYWTWCQQTPLGLNYQEFIKTHENADEALAITPAILANDGVSRNTNRASLTQNTFYCFNADMTDDEVAAWLKMIDWAYASQENYRTIWYGLEGEHWDWDAEGLSQPIGDYALDKGLQNKIGAYTTLGAVIEPFDYQAGVRGNMAKWARDLNLDDPTFERYGIVDQLVVTPESYNLYWTELDKMQREAYIDIITGEKPVEYFDEFVANWMVNGGAQITEEATEWYKTQK